MSILNYFKKKETPLCLERIDKSNETSASLQLTSTELMECVVTELKSVKSKGEWSCKLKIKVCFWEMDASFHHFSSSKRLHWVKDRREKFVV